MGGRGLAGMERKLYRNEVQQEIIGRGGPSVCTSLGKTNRPTRLLASQLYLLWGVAQPAYGRLPSLGDLACRRDGTEIILIFPLP